MSTRHMSRILPCSQISQIAIKYFDRFTSEMMLMPIIADLQHEYCEAEHETIKRWFILLRGYWSFWMAISLNGLTTKEANMRIAKSVGMNAFALAVFWILGFLLIRLGYVIDPNGWMTQNAGQFLGCLAGLALALLIRARIAAYLIAGFLAVTASELAVHAYYGIRAAQGAATHFAVLGGSLLGVVLGALLAFCGPRFASRPDVRKTATSI